MPFTYPLTYCVCSRRSEEQAGNLDGCPRSRHDFGWRQTVRAAEPAEQPGRRLLHRLLPATTRDRPARPQA